MNYPLAASSALAVAAHLAAPLLLGSHVRARLETTWRYFLFGSLVFGVSQLCLFVPVSSRLYDALADYTPPTGRASLAWIGLLAAGTSLVEQCGRYLGLKHLFGRGQRTWANALMYGLGHGGLENMFLFGLPRMIALLNVLIIPTLNPEALRMSPAEAYQLELLKTELAQAPFWEPLMEIAERLSMLSVQCSLAVLVLQVYLRCSWRWLVYACLFHSASIFIPYAAAIRLGPLGAPGLLAGFAIVAVYILQELRPEANTAS